MGFTTKCLSTSFILSLIGSCSCLNATLWLDELPKDIQLEIMKHKGVAKVLAPANRHFHHLGHDSSLQEHIQHSIPSSEEFAKIRNFLPAVKLGFQATPQELSRLHGITFLDISETRLGKYEALALLQISSLKELSLGSKHLAEYSSEASTLLDSQNPKDHTVGMALYKLMLKDKATLKRFEAARVLFGSSNEEDKRIGKAALMEIVKDKANPKRSFAARILFDWGNEEDQKIARPILRKAAQKPNLNNFDVVESLFMSSNEEDKKIARPILRKAVQDKTNPDHLVAAYTLFYNKNNEEDKRIGRAALIEIAKDKANPKHSFAVRTLFDWGNKEDKKMFSHT